MQLKILLTKYLTFWWGLTLLILDSISYSMETLWTEVPSLWNAYSHCSASNFFTLITSSCPEVSGLLAWREIRVNIGSGNGLLTDGTNVDLLLSSEAFCGIHPRAISHQVLINLIHNICLEITLFELDMSTACQCLKSPKSLYGTSIHPTMVTLRSWSQSWMIDSHTFRSMSISPPYPHIRFWREEQKSLRRTRTRILKRTENIVTPDWGDLITTTSPSG